VDRMGLLGLWHAKLGHQSLKGTWLVLVVGIRKDSNFWNKFCDICHRAK